MDDYAVTGSIPGFLTRAGRLPNAFQVRAGRGTRIVGTGDTAAVSRLLSPLGLHPIVEGERAALKVWVMRYDETNMQNPEDARGGYDEIILGIPAARDPGAQEPTDIYMARVVLDSVAPLESGIVGAGLHKDLGRFEVEGSSVRVRQSDGTEILHVDVPDARSEVQADATRVDWTLTNPDVLAPTRVMRNDIGIVERVASRPFSSRTDTFSWNRSSDFGRQLSELGFLHTHIERVDGLGIGVTARRRMSATSIAARAKRALRDALGTNRE